MAKPKKEKPRMNSFKIDKIPKPFANRHKRIKSVRLEKIDIDSKCERDIQSNKGFYITNELDYDEKKKVRTSDGLYSPKYGADAFSDKLLDNMYHCECGDLVGGVHEGDICPKCNTPVQFTDADLSITGYIPLDDYVVINPAVYLDLEKLIGKKDLLSILKYNEKYDVSGHHIPTATKSSPYTGIGLMKFQENFDEIIEFYKNKRKDKIDSYKNIRKFRNCVFTHNLAVYSSLLRPYVKDGSKMSVFDANKKYSVMLANANIVREEQPIGVDRSIITEKSLFEIQSEWNELFSNMIDQSLSGKKGMFRNNMLAARIDHSSRTIVDPAKFHNVDEISIPYVLGLELLRPLLINAIRVMDNKNIREANNIIDAGIRKFDEKLWLLVNHILQESDNPPRIMIQRSPSLLQESMRLMKIKSVKYDYNDLTTDVPIAILNGMNADFDGDTFSLFAIYDNRLKEVWDYMHSPVNHFISRHDGQYSGLCKFIKDTSVSLSEIWELGKNSTYYDEWASPSEKNEKFAC